MDAVAGLLDGPRARGAFLLRSTLAAPWSMRIADEAPLTFLAVVRGGAAVVPDAGEPVRLERGDACLLRGPDAYTVADDPATEPQVLVLPGQRCVTPEGREVVMRRHGVRTWGNAPGGETELLTGTYQLDGAVGGRLLRALPPLAVDPRRRAREPADRAAGRRDRARRARPGGGARPPARPAADRRAARLALARGRGRARLVPRARRPGRRPRAAADPRRPGAPVDGRGARAARPASRGPRSPAASPSSSGEPPMSYLAGWRIALAADLLLEPGDDDRLRRRARSATAARTRSRPPSSACAA